MITAFKATGFLIEHVRVNLKDIILIFDSQLKAFSVAIAVGEVIIAT